MKMIGHLCTSFYLCSVAVVYGCYRALLLYAGSLGSDTYAGTYSRYFLLPMSFLDATEGATLR